ncbi:MAG: ribosome-associated translation inhibitor RaiA [Myxococcota bacterium]
MKITYSFRHMDASDAVKAHAAEKLVRLERFEDREMAIDTVFSTDKFQKSVEFKVSGAHGSFVLSETSDDMYAAIDVGVDKLDQVLSRDKAKRKHHKGNSSTTPHEM